MPRLHSFSSPASERKIETHEVAAISLVQPSPGSALDAHGRELLMPRKSGPTVHEWVVAVANREHISVPEIAGVGRKRLLGHAYQLVAAYEEQLGRISVVGFEGACIPLRSLRS